MPQRTGLLGRALAIDPEQVEALATLANITPPSNGTSPRRVR